MKLLLLFTMIIYTTTNAFADDKTEVLCETLKVTPHVNHFELAMKAQFKLNEKVKEIKNVSNVSAPATEMNKDFVHVCVKVAKK